MAYDIGPRIGIEGEKEFRSAINQINAQIKTMGAEMAVATARYAQNADSVEALTRKEEILTNQITAQREKIDRLNQGLAQSINKYGDSDEKTQKWRQTVLKAIEDLYKMENSLEDVRTDLDRATNSTDDLEDSTDDVTKSTKKMSDALDDTGKSALSLGDIIKANLISEAIISGVGKLADMFVDLGKVAINVGMDFEKGMSLVASTMGIDQTSTDFAILKEAAEAAGATTKYSATEAAEALNYLALAGYDTQKAVETLPEVLNLAAAGDLELAQASDIMTNAMSALGDMAGDTSLFVDKMAAAAQYSNTDVDQLGESILQVGGTARVLSGGITELDTALGILANSGIKAAEGGTHLRNILLALTAPTDKARDALDALGITTLDQDGNLRALDDIFKDLQASMSGLTEAQQQATLGDIFNVTDLAAVQAMMLGVGESWDDLEAKINNAEGAAAKMSETMQDNLAGDMEELSSAAESLGISFYDTFNTNLRGLVQDATESVNELGAAMEEGGIKGFVAELGTQAAQWSVVITDAVPDVVDAAFDLVEAVGDAIVDNADQIVGAVERTAGVLVSRVAELLPVLIPGIVQLIQSLCTYIADHVDDVIQVALVIVQALVTGLINAIPILLEAIPEIITALCDGIMDSLDTLEEEGNSLINSLVAGIVEAIPLLIEAVPQVIEALVSAIITLLPRIVEVAFELIGALANGIADALPLLLEGLWDLGSAIIDTIMDVGPQLWQAGQDLIGQLWDGIVGALGWVVEKLGDAFGWIADKIGGLFDDENIDVKVNDFDIDDQLSDTLNAKMQDIDSKTRDAAGAANGDAMIEELRAIREQNEKGQTIVMDGKKVGQTVTRRQNAANRAAGKTLVTV